MPIAQTCRKKAFDAGFGKASELSPWNNTIRFAKLPSFAIGHCLNENAGQVGLGYPDRFIRKEEADSVSIEAVMISLQGAVGRAFGESNPLGSQVDENRRPEPRHQGRTNQDKDDCICQILLLQIMKCDRKDGCERDGNQVTPHRSTGKRKTSCRSFSRDRSFAQHTSSSETKDHGLSLSII